MNKIIDTQTIITDNIQNGNDILLQKIIDYDNSMNIRMLENNSAITSQLTTQQTDIAELITEKLSTKFQGILKDIDDNEKTQLTLLANQTALTTTGK